MIDSKLINPKRFAEYLDQEIAQLQNTVDVLNGRLATMKDLRRAYISIQEDEIGK